MLRLPRWFPGAAILLVGLWSLVNTGEDSLSRLPGSSAAPADLGAYAVIAAVAAGEPNPALDQPTRRRIYAHLVALPGNHFRSIARTLGLGMGEVRHHLDVLLAEGLVYEETTNGRARFYPNVPPAQAETNDLFAKHWKFRDTRERIVRAAGRLELATPVEVARALGISRQLAAYHLTQLEKAGIVRRERVSYRLTDSATLQLGTAGPR